MIGLKKVYRDELLQLALLLSLLRSNPEISYENDLYNTVNELDLDNGTSWRSIGSTLIRNQYMHPKSLDSALMNYEREVFEDLNALGRYNNNGIRQRNITAYVLNVTEGVETSGGEAQPADGTLNPANEEGNADDLFSGDPEPGTGWHLTEEDMDLIEVLWKQDVDLGVPLDVAPAKIEKQDANTSSCSSGANSNNEDDMEKLKSLKEINEGCVKLEPDALSIPDTDPWEGLNYTIDTETGEYVIKGELEDQLNTDECGGPSCDLPLGDLSFQLPEFLLDRLLDEDSNTQDESVTAQEFERLVKISEGEASASVSLKEAEKATASSSSSSNSSTSSAPSLSELSGGSAADGSASAELDLLQEMIQTSQFHHPHHRAFHQGRMPFVRTMSVEQRWQDLANLLSLPNPGDASGMQHAFSHHHHHLHNHHALHNFSHPHHGHGMGYSPADSRSVLLHNATLQPPMGDLNATSVPSYSNLGGGTNLGNAVATSMNLTNSSEPMGEGAASGHYKGEPTHDMMYYQNATSDYNQTDGLFASFLNDEDLQLMDMAMNEGMYTMRMLDSNTTANATITTGAVAAGGGNLTMAAGNTVPAPSSASAAGAGATGMTRMESERVDTSSDSAVSSMGSERVPSLSDGEWCDGGSDSGHTPGDHYATDYPSKYRPYDYSYSGRQHSMGPITSAATTPEASRLPPVAQKKHQMFGKRCFQEHQGANSSVLPHHPPVPIKYEYGDSSNISIYSPGQSDATAKQGDVKYSCALEFGRQHYLQRNHLDHIQHNHTYHLPAENAGAMQRPLSRDKAKAKKCEDEHLTRDEKRARALSVPIAVDDIINLPMDEFNERLSKYDLSEAQLSLIRDIRRRGKNKVAAQNCRKRKLDQILCLADEVKDMRDRKIRLLSEREYLLTESQRIKDKYQQLYRHVFQNLRDPDGNHYSPYQYSLQTSADGSILIVPRANSSVNPECKEPQHKD